MTRAYTETELGYIRSGRQASELMLAVMNPNVVYTAQVAGTPAGVTGVREIVIDTESGTLTDVLEGMTVWFGSSAGGYDKGIARVKAIETGLLTIGVTSDLPYAAIDDYVTILDSMGWWPKPVVTDPIEGTLYADDSVAYAGQHADWKPMVLMGPDVVAELSEETVDVTCFDAGDSWVPDDTVASYAWSAPGATLISGEATATPTITYDTHGTYLVSCTVTATNGETNSGYRRVYVWDAEHKPVTNFTLDSFSGSYESGGWSCKITVYSGLSITDLYDGAQVVLFANERYGSYGGSIGPYAGRETIKMIGWVDGESIKIGYDRSSVTFEIYGPHEWIKKLTTLGCNLEDATESPTDWCSIEGMTVDKALADLCIWQSTIGSIIDIHANGDTKRIPSLEVYGSTMWAAIGILGSKIKALPCCNRYGALYLEVDQQLIEDDDRDGLPLIMDISRQDWREEVEFGRKPNEKASKMDVSGSYWSGGGYTAVRAGSGNFPGRFGQPQSETMLFDDEDHALAVVGHLRAKLNNEYPSVIVKPAANHGLIDVCPRQYISMSLEAGDTPRGIVWDEKRLIPRVISVAQNDNGKLQFDIDCEAETSGPPGVLLPVASDAPVYAEVDTNYEIEEPDYPMMPTGSIEFPDFLTGGDGPVSDGCRDTLSAPWNGPYTLWPDKFYLTTQEADKLSTLLHYPCMVRSAGATHKTYVRIYGAMEYLSGGVWRRSYNTSGWQFEAVDADQAAILMAHNEGKESALISHLEPVSQMDVHGFELSLVEPIPASSGSYSKLFEFNIGWDGWTYDNGDHPENIRCDGQLECIKQACSFYWHPPSELYAESGATVECDKQVEGTFASLGINYVTNEDPLSLTYDKVLTRYSTHPIYTVPANHSGKRIDSIRYYTDSNNMTWEYGNRTQIDNVQLTGFTSNPILQARRLFIEKIELYNVCGL